MIQNFRENTTSEMSNKFLGVMHTYWSSTKKFMDEYNEINPPNNEKENEVECFKEMVKSVKNLN